MLKTAEAAKDYKDKSPILIAIGVLSLLAGTGIAFLGPVEVYCFYLFTEGGRFHYPGFGFGSFMFGNIAAQIACYYLIAAVLIPFGYGHVTRRRWARPLGLTLVWCWLILGIPLGILFILVLLASKETSVAGAIVAIVWVGAAYLILPRLLLRFYKSRDLRLCHLARGLACNPNRKTLEPPVGEQPTTEGNKRSILVCTSAGFITPWVRGLSGELQAFPRAPCAATSAVGLPARNS